MNEKMIMNMMVTALAFIFFIYFGVKCAFYTVRTRQEGLDNTEKLVQKYGISRYWINNYSPAWLIRTFGILALLVAAFLGYSLLKKIFSV